MGRKDKDRKSGHSRRVEGFFEDREEHFDDDGNKIGETRYEQGWFGPKKVHYDADGNKIGQSEPGSDLFGQPRDVHYDNEGRRVGESHKDTDLFGTPRERHYDRAGERIGTSDKRQGFFEDRTEHRGTWFKAGASPAGGGGGGGGGGGNGCGCIGLLLLVLFGGSLWKSFQERQEPLAQHERLATLPSAPGLTTIDRKSTTLAIEPDTWSGTMLTERELALTCTVRSASPFYLRVRGGTRIRQFESAASVVPGQAFRLLGTVPGQQVTIDVAWRWSPLARVAVNFVFTKQHKAFALARPMRVRLAFEATSPGGAVFVVDETGYRAGNIVSKPWLAWSEFTQRTDDALLPEGRYCLVVLNRTRDDVFRAEAKLHGRPTIAGETPPTHPGGKLERAAAARPAAAPPSIDSIELARRRPRSPERPIGFATSATRLAVAVTAGSWSRLVRLPRAVRSWKVTVAPPYDFFLQTEDGRIHRMRRDRHPRVEGTAFRLLSTGPPLTATVEIARGMVSLASVRLGARAPNRRVRSQHGRFSISGDAEVDVAIRTSGEVTVWIKNALQFRSRLGHTHEWSRTGSCRERVRLSKGIWYLVIAHGPERLGTGWGEATVSTVR